MKMNHLLNQYFEFVINAPPFLSNLDTFKAFFRFYQYRQDWIEIFF